MVEREKLIAMVRGVQTGNEEAAGQVYETFRDDFYYFILKTVKNDRELAEDLTQDTFVEILEKIHTLDEPAAFVTWAKQIAYHKCTDYFKKRRELLLDENEDGTTLMDTLAEDDSEFIPDEALDSKDLKQTILNMINELPEEQRAALLLRYYNEISVKEIAQIQSVSEGTVKSRLNYARKTIKQSVETYEKKNGIKLHCAGVVPMLLWLFRQYRIANKLSLTTGMATQTYTEAQGTATASAVLSGGAASGSTSGTAASAAATGTAKAAAGAGVKAAVTALSTKVVAGVVAAAVVIGGIAVGVTKTQKPEMTQPTVAVVQQEDETGTLTGEEETLLEQKKAPCEHTWKPLYCMYELEGVVVPSTYYACTTCEATIMGQGCPHPEVTIVDGGEYCSLCGWGATAHYRQYLSAPGGEGLPAFTFPNTYHEAEPEIESMCNHIWETVRTEVVPITVDETTYAVCTALYECALCAEQLEGFSGHTASTLWEGALPSCYGCETTDTHGTSCQHSETYKFYYTSYFGGERYCLICKNCNAPVLIGIPVEAEEPATEESSVINLQDYLDFSKSWGIGTLVPDAPFPIGEVCDFVFLEDGTFHCLFYYRSSGNISGYHGNYAVKEVDRNQLEITFTFDQGTIPAVYTFNPNTMQMTQMTEIGLLSEGTIGTTYTLANDELFPTAEEIISKVQQFS